jgi:hypothetical protein
MLQRALPAGFIAPCLSMKCRAALFYFAAPLILGGCTREEATARLRGDLQPEDLEIIHARFPCRSPDMHFFGYRFRIKVQGEYADGYICWNVSDRKWTWQILREYPLSRLNIRK